MQRRPLGFLALGLICGLWLPPHLQAAEDPESNAPVIYPVGSEPQPEPGTFFADWQEPEVR